MGTNHFKPDTTTGGAFFQKADNFRKGYKGKTGSLTNGGDKMKGNPSSRKIRIGIEGVQEEKEEGWGKWVDV